ncbi:MAG: hypothetical protein GX357_00175 [Firmicutes bacterium]|nr:hypothetical protein [Bacillota bacterium]
MLKKLRVKTGMLTVLLIPIFLVVFMVACTTKTKELDPASVIRQPAYELAIHRTESWFLFYETDTHVGFQVADGIYLYNYQKDLMEVAFAMTEDAFPPEFTAVPLMSANEISILVHGFDPGNDVGTDYFYRYDILSGKVCRLEGKVQEVAEIYPHPDESRMLEAFQADSRKLEDIRYIPKGSDTYYYPFKNILR